MNGIESVKKNSQDMARFDKKVAKNGMHHFNLKSTNGQIVGSSQMYSSEDGCDNGITSVQKNAADAEVVDNS
jgi:uncharacterized protein YegP (UPF0339 family)